jgi:uncharacterized protein YbcI
MSKRKGRLSQGEIEAEFTKRIVKFEKDYLGRGPVEARTYLIDDMVIIRLRGVLTAAEEKLIETTEGRQLVKETRRQLFDTSRSIMEGYTREILGKDLLAVFSDISLATGERVIVLTLNGQHPERNVS